MEFHLQMKLPFTPATVKRRKRGDAMSEIGQPERVVRRERENEPSQPPVVPLTSPELEPAQ